MARLVERRASNQKRAKTGSTPDAVLRAAVPLGKTLNAIHILGASSLPVVVA